MKNIDRKLKIGIDARMFHESGIGRYIRNLIDQLQKIDSKNEYAILLTRTDYHKLIFRSNFKKVLADFKWYSLNEQLRLHSLLNLLNLDLVHFPHFNVPIFFKGKFVVTIHDLIHQHFQMKRATTHGPITYTIKQLGYKAVFKTAITRSTKIFTPSNYVKDLLIKDWQIESQKIKVTLEGVDDKILTIIRRIATADIRKVLDKFNIKQPYIFYVGNAHPHKNVEGLIRVFRELKKKYQYLQLVLSGNDHYFWQRLRRENQHKDIIYTGYIADEELVALYRQAAVFVMPSFEEGFGIPILEAMAGRCAVVSSNAGALLEVGGDGAIYFDPASPEDMADKIDQVLNDKNLQVELIEKGQKRVKLFSWKSLAEQTLEVYNSCV
ncbi:glycosyltransferase family 4 protein [Candidatus Daviesbacteria bacterium]|nr:glycosyltransferase family 4 protein [Candidatus Daviesbacteria bacterium]